jgi:hypothetical protein
LAFIRKIALIVDADRDEKIVHAEIEIVGLVEEYLGTLGTIVVTLKG